MESRGEGRKVRVRERGGSEGRRGGRSVKHKFILGLYTIT